MKLTRTELPRSSSSRFSDQLKSFITNNSYPGGPMKMVADTFKSGIQCVALGDPHPICKNPEYGLFLLELVRYLHKTVGLKELIVEGTERYVKEELPQQVKVWNDSKVDDFKKFWEKVEAEYSDIDQGKTSRVELFGVVEDWETGERDPEGVRIEEILNKRKCLDHVFLALNYATKNGITITGIDPRDTKEQEDGLMKDLFKELVNASKARRTVSIENVFSRVTDANTPITGSAVDFAMFEKTMERLSVLKQNEKALLIAGGGHLFNNPALKRLGYFLRVLSNLNTCTILSEVGLSNEKKEELEKLELNFFDFMDEVNIPYTALNSTTENEEIASLVIHRIGEATTLGDFAKVEIFGEETEAMRPRYPLRVGDFDKLIYLASRKDISDLLQVVKD